MNFYFCDGCNKRITDADLAAGKGKNKQLKGIYCLDCASGVNTIEFEPLVNLNVTDDHPAPAAPVPPVPVAMPEPSRSNITRRTPPHRSTPGSATTAMLQAQGSSKMKQPRSRVSGARGTEASMPTVKSSDEVIAPKSIKNMVIGGAVVGAVAVVGLCVVLFTGKPPVPVKVANAETDKHDKAMPTKPVELAPPAPTTPVKEREQLDDKQMPRTGQDMLLTAGSAQDKEQKDFDATMRKIEALADDHSADKIALADVFVKAHPDSMLASRLRVKMNEWKPKERAIEAVAATAPVTPVAALEKNNGTAATPGATKILFTTVPAGLGGKFYNDAQMEEHEIFGSKDTVAKASAIPNPPWHSTQMSVNLDKKVAPVHLGPNSWFRFACRLENTGSLMVHLFADNGFYEAHFYGQPTDKWFWMVVKCSDFKRNIRGGDPIPKDGAEVHAMVLYSGDNKKPSTLYVGQFDIGDGALPKN